jgi:hypothetical protein
MSATFFLFFLVLSLLCILSLEAGKNYPPTSAAVP